MDEFSITIDSQSPSASSRRGSLNTATRITADLPQILRTGRWEVALESVQTTVRTLSPSDRSFELEVVGLEHHLFGVISYVKFRNKSALIEAFQEKIQQVLDAAQIPKNDQPVITVENNYLKWIPNKVKYVDNMNILSQIMGFHGPSLRVEPVDTNPNPINMVHRKSQLIVDCINTYSSCECGTTLAKFHTLWDAQCSFQPRQLRFKPMCWWSPRDYLEIRLLDSHNRPFLIDIFDSTEVVLKFRRIKEDEPNSW